MSLYDPLEFRENEHPVLQIDTYDGVPEGMDLFYRTIEAFIPEGKTLDDLSPEEIKKIAAKYRFDPYIPGVYQAITGFGNML